MGISLSLFGAAKDARRNIDEINKRLLSSLNPEQYDAVISLDNPLLVLSGAGTGKTKVLTTKIAYIIENGFALPSQILAVTFTNRAAGEMKTRLQAMVDGVDDIWVGTFHHTCVRILREHGDKIGLNRNFKILDSGRHASKDAVSLDRLLPCTMQLFNDHKEVLAKYREKFKYILVDEYQDTSSYQYDWLKELCPDGKGLCCVGDDDQSIYSWRGADIRNILDFEERFEGVKTVKLEQNYRSKGDIVKAAARLIAHNTERKEKTLRTDEKPGRNFKALCLKDDFCEMKYVFEKINSLHETEKLKYSDIAVLVRSNSRLDKFKDYLIQHNIPCKVAEPDNLLEERVSTKKSVKKAVNEDAVSILTLHASKGLEFEAVFLVGWREGAFPAFFGEGVGNEEEERRLAYVGLTRARKYVYITYSAYRKVRGTDVENRPSRFIRELTSPKGSVSAVR